MRRLLLATVAVAALSCGSQSVPGETRQALGGGTADPDDPAVVAVVARRTACEQPDPTLVCTGTLIAPRVVLTAAHCLTLSTRPVAYEVLQGTSTSDPQARFAAVTRVERHPLWAAGSADHDVALLRLAEPLPAAPIPLRTAALDGSVAGSTVRTAGFGSTSPAGAAGAKRQGTMTLDRLDAATFRAIPPGATLCLGDYGAPALLSNGGTEELAGVLAAGDPACTQLATGVRIDTLLADFIQPFLDATTPAPTGFSPTAFAPDQLCSSRCVADADCPAGMACIVEAGAEGQCILAGWGDYGAACQTHADCASPSTCARLTPESCRCFTPCAATRRHTCDYGTAGDVGGPGVLAAIALLLAWRRRRT